MSMTSQQGARLRPPLRARMLVGVLLAFACGASAAQRSEIHSIAVPFRGAAGGNGYSSATANVSYAFIACQGEVHIAYSLDNAPARVGSTYLFDGKSYPVTAAPPTPVTIHFSGTVWRGPAQVGSFSDGLAAQSLGMGCFSGQTQQVARIGDVVGPNATSAQVTAYLRSLSIQVKAGEVLKSAAQESVIRTELRRAEAVAAAEKRKAEQDAAAQAQREAAQRQAAEAQAAAQASSNQDSGVPQGGYASVPSTPAPSVPAPPPPTDAQRVANAIASDRVLADQRLEQQRAALAQQQARMADAERQHAEAVAAVMPQAVELGANIVGAIEAWDEQRKARNYRDAQARLVGKCLLPNGMAAPKDGEIQLGVELESALTSEDCGARSTSRYKAFKLELAEPTRLQFTIKAPNWLASDHFQVDINDLNKVNYLDIGWDEWGLYQKTMRKDVALPAGVYVVLVQNGYEDVFARFTLRLDPLDEHGQLIAAAAPAALNAATEAQAAPVGASAITTAWTALSKAVTAVTAPVSAGASTATLGMTVETGERARIATLDPAGPAALAGLMVGDEIHLLTVKRKRSLLADQLEPKSQSEIDALMATSSVGATTTVWYVRDGQPSRVQLQLGGAQ